MATNLYTFHPDYTSVPFPCAVRCSLGDVSLTGVLLQLLEKSWTTIFVGAPSVLEGKEMNSEAARACPVGCEIVRRADFLLSLLCGSCTDRRKLDLRRNMRALPTAGLVKPGDISWLR